MGTRAPFDDPFDHAGWPATPGVAPASALPDQLERRLAAIEDRLTSLEGSLRVEIAEDLDAVSQEMRRAVSELGRLLLRDLDRLTRVLGEHRDAIVDRLLAEMAAALPPAADEPEPPPVDDEVPVPAPVETPALTGEDERWRVPRKQRRRAPKPASGRSPKPSPGGDTEGG